MKVIVSPDGQMTVIAHADLQSEQIAAFGDVANVQRIGHVVPTNKAKRFVFTLIRRFFTGRHPIANWTRRWKGPWIIVVKSKQVCSAFDTRQEAIRYEELLAEESLIMFNGEEK